ncbi:MAG: transporter ATP-binding protein [Acidimicrobiales bacterium]|nr:transporter ATP-binding protein [Acidimicrobiales bacterium]
MSLHARVVVDTDRFRLDVDLTVPAGQTAAIVGPNGAGKSTLLRALAGLVPLTDGRITLGDRVLADAAAGIHVAPEHRSVGFMFQDDLLFPHLSVLDNVAFGLRHRGRSRAQAHAEAMPWLEQLDLVGQATARPRQLSGGQAQRVALARALAPGPDLLLLDEPLTALDAGARPAVRRDLRRLLAGFAGVPLIVTHDPLEALTMAQHLVVLEGGRISQEGTPAEIAARPRSSYIAQLVGTNLFEGVVADGVLRTDAGLDLAVATGLHGAVFAVVHPRAVSLHRERPSGSPRNVWSGPIENLDVLGDRARVLVGGPRPLVAEITTAALADLQLHEGDPVWLAVKATEVEAYAV